MTADVTELLEPLVGFDTTSGRATRAIADFIAARLARPGVEITEVAAADGERANLLVRVGPPTPDDGAGLVLSGHLDTVPATEDDWHSDPWQLTDGGDRWIGRGACDMKGFLALAVGLAAELPPDRLAAPLVLLFTYDEELGSLGAQRFAATAADRPPLPRRVVIGEPTSLKVVRMHKGHVRLGLEVFGVAAHSGYPHRGSNAIESAARAVTALGRLEEELEAETPAHYEMFPETPFVALNVGRIEGGSAVNVIPDRCRIELGLRPLPGGRSEDLTERVRAAVAAALPNTRHALEVDNDSPAFLLPEEAPLHRELCALVGQTESLAVPFSSDAGTLQGLGHDCVLFGPGSIDVAHRANEFVPKAELGKAADILRRLVRRLCVRSEAA